MNCGQHMSQVAILVVDDSPENIDILASILRGAYQVKAAISGERALKVVAAAPPDLILLDIMMPDMDGFEVMERLKSDPQAASIPVIFVTGKTDDADREKGLALGAAGFITKPVAPDIVLATVKEHLPDGS